MTRYLYRNLFELALNRNKMAFISGPRQVGKTTLAKSLKKDFDEFSYKNWDETEFRRLWVKSPNQVKDDFNLTKIGLSRLLVLDEIHKSKNWKQKVKGIFDELSEEVKILVTGSARLNTFKKGGDSLLGRYLLFRLHPFSFGELSQIEPLSPEAWRNNLFLRHQHHKMSPSILSRLFKYSGFPEPYFAQSEKVLNVWRRGRNEKIVREDLRDISRLPELSQIEMLTSLLPEKVGSPLSVQSLREDLEVAHDTVTRWLKYLNELYYFFEIRPWTKSVVRTLKKEPKIYLYDWTNIESKGVRFENMLASHLIKACHFWTDTGEGTFELHYLRNKEKQEIDFLIVKNKKPWLMVEAKLSDCKIDEKIVKKFKTSCPCPYIQVVLESNIWQVTQENLVCSFDRFSLQLP